MFKKLKTKLQHQGSSNDYPGSSGQPNDFQVKASTIQEALNQQGPSIPELFADGPSLANTEQCKQLLRITDKFRVQEIPVLNDNLYGEYKRSGDRKSYEDPYFARRAEMTAHALSAYVSPQPEQHLNELQKHIDAICNEPSWVVPAHTRCRVDLFNAETGFALAQIVDLLRDKMDRNLVNRVYQEIDKRILTPYEQNGRNEEWFSAVNNWNGVVNSSVGSCFLLMPIDPKRAANGASQALEGLSHYINKGFGSDGATTEGVGYWQYGLSYLTAFLELLSTRTGGRVDLLTNPRLATIASSAAKLQLGPNKFAPFADADEEKMTFTPGFVSRISDRLGQPELRNLLALPQGGSFSQSTVAISKSALVFRDLAWWNGDMPPADTNIGDSVLPDTGITRMAIKSGQSPPLVVIAKAGHNGEEHNHCDVGSFVVHFNDANYITDPGKGLYNKQYFDAKTRYQTLWPRSDGHSVPIPANKLQGVGDKFRGSISGINQEGNGKSIDIDFAGAYEGCSDLRFLKRHISIQDENGRYVVYVQDTCSFTNQQPFRSQFMTFMDVNQENDKSVIINGPHQAMRMTVLEPESATLRIEDLSEESKKQKKPKPLRRIVADVREPSKDYCIKLKLEVQ
ncbi:hypothetical protein NQZ79_g3932 [Umbelopsis isabellina]|nr:hypothetical protein NQZ79_g3932 [Umbelopsis isabellina]